MKPVGVLHLLNNFGDSSISRIVQKILINLGPHDFAWHVGGLSNFGDMQQEFRDSNSTVVVFPNRKTFAIDIRDYIAANNIQIIHTHTPRAIIKAAIAKGKSSSPIHLATKHILNAVRDRKCGLFYTVIDRLSLYLPDHIIAVSEDIYNKVKATPGLHHERVTLVRNAIDWKSYHLPGQRADCRQEFGLDSELTVIGSAGRLEKVKRYDLLLKGFAAVLAQHSKTRLMIIGDGALRTELETLAAKIGISHALIWTGFRNDIPRLLAAIDIYIQTSVNEGLSLTILEAMAAGKPVIITDVGGAKETIPDCSTGIIIPSGSVAAISTALNELLVNPEMQAKLALTAGLHVRREFDLQNMMLAYQQIYKHLILSHSGV